MNYLVENVKNQLGEHTGEVDLRAMIRTKLIDIKQSFKAPFENGQHLSILAINKLVMRFDRQDELMIIDSSLLTEGVDPQLLTNNYIGEQGSNQALQGGVELAYYVLIEDTEDVQQIMDRIETSSEENENSNVFVYVNSLEKSLIFEISKRIKELSNVTLLNSVDIQLLTADFDGDITTLSEFKDLSEAETIKKFIDTHWDDPFYVAAVEKGVNLSAPQFLMLSKIFNKPMVTGKSYEKTLEKMVSSDFLSYSVGNSRKTFHEFIIDLREMPTIIQTQGLVKSVGFVEKCVVHVNAYNLYTNTYEDLQLDDTSFIREVREVEVQEYLSLDSKNNVLRLFFADGALYRYEYHTVELKMVMLQKELKQQYKIEARFVTKDTSLNFVNPEVMPKEYAALKALVQKAGKTFREFSPCSNEHRYLLREFGSAQDLESDLDQMFSKANQNFEKLLNDANTLMPTGRLISKGFLHPLRGFVKADITIPAFQMEG